MSTIRKTSVASAEWEFVSAFCTGLGFMLGGAALILATPVVAALEVAEIIEDWKEELKDQFRRKVCPVHKRKENQNTQRCGSGW